MNIELKQAAQDAAEAIDWLLKNIRRDAPQLSGKAMGNAEKCASALRTALAQQPATATACGIPGMAKTTCPYCDQEFAFEHEQPATPEPVRGVIGMGAHALAGELAQAVAQDDADPEGHDMSAGLFGPNVSAWLRKVAYYAGKQPTTTEPVEDGIRNAEDELNCAEEVLDAITCEFSDGEFPVTDFNCIGDYITTVVDVFKERLAAQQPATGEPVKSLLRDMQAIADGAIKIPSREFALHALAEFGTHPAPSVLKDDQIAALVNKVRDIARMFHDHQSLRERIAIELVPALKVSQEAKSDAERGRLLIEWLKRYGLLQAEFGQMGAGEKPEAWWLLHAPWGIDQTRPFLGHGKTPEQAIDAALRPNHNN